MLANQMIQTILWDVDNTLLDFHAGESAAIHTLFEEFGLGVCTDGMVNRYSQINDGLWKKLERGEVTKKDVLIGRFEQFFSEYHIDSAISSAFNERYQLALGDTIVYRDDSIQIIKSLTGTVKQYAVSNGTITAQTKKLDRSGLGALLDGVFLSEELGVEKPNAAFFERLFHAQPDIDRNQCMIVGDSLTSDIQGGMNAGIITCWYNPGHLPTGREYRIDYEIEDLHQIPDILQGNLPPCRPF